MRLEKYKQVIGEDFAEDADFIDETIKNLNLDETELIEGDLVNIFIIKKI